MTTKKLFNELEKRTQQVSDYITQSPFYKNAAPNYLKEGAILYTQRGGKMLRPTVLMLACEAVGGNPEVALPAAAAIEVSHTWTLVHDDLMDNDDMRRGGPSVHAYYREKFRDTAKNSEELEEVSRNMALLVGDLQQSWATGMMNEMSGQVDVEVYRFLVYDLATNWAPKVMEGQALDVEYSKRLGGVVEDKDIIYMLTQKTASTFQFAGRAGALIGLNRLDLDSELVQTIEGICLEAGIAFQIKDDILGVIGDTEKLGKPVGSDLREGKKTLMIAQACRVANPSQKQILNAVLGHTTASDADVELAHKLLIELGTIEYANKQMMKYADKAREHLDKLPDSRAKDLLGEWIKFIIERDH